MEAVIPGVLASSTPGYHNKHPANSISPPSCYLFLAVRSGGTYPPGTLHPCRVVLLSVLGVLGVGLIGLTTYITWKLMAIALRWWHSILVAHGVAARSTVAANSSDPTTVTEAVTAAANAATSGFATAANFADRAAMASLHIGG